MDLQQFDKTNFSLWIIASRNSLASDLLDQPDRHGHFQQLDENVFVNPTEVAHFQQSN